MTVLSVLFGGASSQCDNLQYCASCTNNNTICTACIPGWYGLYIDGRGCYPVPDCNNKPDCQTCDIANPTICTQCRPGYGTPTATNKTRCVLCKTNYGCTLCNTLTQCTKCLNTTMGPLFDGSGACAPCTPNCRTCGTSGAGKCDSCQSGFKLQLDKTCKIIEATTIGTTTNIWF
jgi:hypothetical protein